MPSQSDVIADEDGGELGVRLQLACDRRDTGVALLLVVHLDGLDGALFAIELPARPVLARLVAAYTEVE